MKKLATYSPDILFDLVVAERSSMTFLGDDGEIYSVRTRSARYVVFHKSKRCAICGMEGTKMVLEQPLHQEGSKAAHFNFYGEDEYGHLVMLTKDHVLPASKGGKDRIENYQTMCVNCNNHKKDRCIPNKDLIAELEAARAERAKKIKDKGLPVQGDGSTVVQPSKDSRVED